MKYFTGNPLEREMMRPPAGRVKPDPPPPISQGHPCFGCKRWGESSCVLPCYRGVERMPPR